MDGQNNTLIQFTAPLQNTQRFNTTDATCIPGQLTKDDYLIPSEYESNDIRKIQMQQNVVSDGSIPAIITYKTDVITKANATTKKVTTKKEHNIEECDPLFQEIIDASTVTNAAEASTATNAAEASTTNAAEASSVNTSKASAVNAEASAVNAEASAINTAEASAINTAEASATINAEGAVGTMDNSNEYVFDYILKYSINNLNISIELKHILITLVQNINIITNKTMSKEFYIALKEQVESEEHQTNLLIKTVNTLNKRIGKTSEILVENDRRLDTKITLVSGEFQSINANFEDMGCDITALKDDLENIKSELNEIKNNITTINEKIPLMDGVVTRNKIGLKNLHDKLSQFRSNLDDIDGRMQIIETEDNINNLIEAKKESNKYNVTKLQKRLDDVEIDNKNLKIQLQENQEDIKHLTTLIEAMQIDHFPKKIPEKRSTLMQFEPPNSHINFQKTKSSEKQSFRRHSGSPDRQTLRHSRSPDRQTLRRHSRSPDRQSLRKHSKSPERYFESPEKQFRKYFESPKKQSSRRYFESPERQLFRRVHNDDDVLPYQLSPSSTNGTLIMQISNFSDRIDEAKNNINKRIFSRPFCSDIHGYKMCMRVHPNGDGNGYGSHVSVFFIIMKGDYDDELDWPFKMKITFELIDYKYQAIVKSAFIPDGSSSFTKPTKELNVPYGLPLFADHSKIHKVLKDTNDILCLHLTVNDVKSKSSHTFSFK